MELGDFALKYVEEERRNFTVEHPEVKQRFQEFEHNLQQVVNRTATFVSTFDKMDREQLYAKWALVMDRTSVLVEEEFPPLENATNHEQRTSDVSRVLQLLEDQLVIVLGPHLTMSEAELKKRFDPTREVIQTVVVATGDIAELHPEAVEMLIFSGIALLLPEDLIVRGILKLVGFGPGGPAKGSIAAWAQRRFFGAYIPVGSWFSRLQHIAMRKHALVIDPIVKVIGSIGLGGLLAGSFSLCRGGR